MPMVMCSFCQFIDGCHVELYEQETEVRKHELIEHHEEVKEEEGLTEEQFNDEVIAYFGSVSAYIEACKEAMAS